MRIFDSQVHLWPPNTAKKPWPPTDGRPSSGEAGFSPEELIAAMDAVGVAAAAVVPPRWAGESNETPLKWALEHPDRLGVMGRFDLWAPDARRAIDGWLQEPNLLGIRASYSPTKGTSWLDPDDYGWFWEAADAQRIPVMMLLQGRQVHHLEAIARRFSDVPLIVDHMGLVIGDPATTDVFEGLPDLIALARYPNVHVKLSALPEYTGEAYPYPSLREPIHRVFDAYGPARLMWGSDLTRLTRATYGQVLDHVRYELEFLNNNDREWILGRTFAKVLRFPERQIGSIENRVEA